MVAWPRGERIVAQPLLTELEQQSLNWPALSMNITQGFLLRVCSSRPSKSDCHIMCVALCVVPKLRKLYVQCPQTDCCAGESTL